MKKILSAVGILAVLGTGAFANSDLDNVREALKGCQRVSSGKDFIKKSDTYTYENYMAASQAFSKMYGEFSTSIEQIFGEIGVSRSFTYMNFFRNYHNFFHYAHNKVLSENEKLEDFYFAFIDMLQFNNKDLYITDQLYFYNEGLANKIDSKKLGYNKLFNAEPFLKYFIFNDNNFLGSWKVHTNPLAREFAGYIIFQKYEEAYNLINRFKDKGSLEDYKAAKLSHSLDIAFSGPKEQGTDGIVSFENYKVKQDKAVVEGMNRRGKVEGINERQQNLFEKVKYFNDFVKDKRMSNKFICYQYKKMEEEIKERNKQ